jgi:hypothetical protein
VRRIPRWKGWLWLALAAAAGGCNGQDTERLGKVGLKAGDKLLDLAGGRQGKLAGGVRALRGTLSERALDDRVATRLSWDRELSAAEVRVLPLGPKGVRLEGRVASAALQKRAEEVAKATLGVEQVVNAVTVAPAAAPGPH